MHSPWIWPEHSGARVTVEAAERAEVRRVADRVLGRTLQPREYADLAGAPDDALVRLDVVGRKLRLGVIQPASYGYCGAHLVVGSRCGPVLICGGYRILDRRLSGQCLALQMFRRQLIGARRLDMRIVLAVADRGPVENGYYLWPRFGFDAALPPPILRSLPRSLRSARRVLDLMQSETGRRWWRRHGTALDVAFDLRPGSRCWAVFHRYLQEKRCQEPLLH